MTQRQLVFTDLEEFHDWLDNYESAINGDQTPTDFTPDEPTLTQNPIEAYISMVLAEATASKTFLTSDQARAIATLDHINRRYNP